MKKRNENVRKGYLSVAVCEKPNPAKPEMNIEDLWFLKIFDLKFGKH